jgi:hypothetical protein
MAQEITSSTNIIKLQNFGKLLYKMNCKGKNQVENTAKSIGEDERMDGK